MNIFKRLFSNLRPLSNRQISNRISEEMKRPTLPRTAMPISITDHVRTTKGSRTTGVKHSGVVVGFTKWRKYDAVKVVRDADGRTMIYLVKNVVRCPR